MRTDLRDRVIKAVRDPRKLLAKANTRRAVSYRDRDRITAYRLCRLLRINRRHFLVDAPAGLLGRNESGYAGLGRGLKLREVHIARQPLVERGLARGRYGEGTNGQRDSNGDVSKCILHVDLQRDGFPAPHRLLKRVPDLDHLAYTGTMARIPEMASPEEGSHLRHGTTPKLRLALSSGTRSGLKAGELSLPGNPL